MPTFHQQALNRGVYGIMPIGHRQHRLPTVAEVVHFETCHAAGAYSAVNCQVPPGVPVWQYVAADERAAARRSVARWPFPRSADDLAAKAVEHRAQQLAAIVNGPEALL